MGCGSAAGHHGVMRSTAVNRRALLGLVALGGAGAGSGVCALERADGRVRLSGYAIGPRRPDERVTVEALWIADPDLLRMEVHDEHDEDCRCRVLWDTVRERYGLDARALPDEMRPMRRQWTHGQVGTWLWWD